MLYENKIDVRYGENLKNLVSSLKSVKLYFDNFTVKLSNIILTDKSVIQWKSIK
jgi:hypothetical protein